AEKAASKAKAEAKKQPPSTAKRRPGRPKGSKNKPQADVPLTPELGRITGMLGALLHVIAGVVSLTYLVLDGHFGNHNALQMARQHNLHLISKLRYDAALYFPLVDYYGLRFQIEFKFRDAKQYWGLEDFMNVTPTGVTNAANLSLFMVNVAYRLRADGHPRDPDYSVLDLKADWRGYKYVEE